MHDFQRIAVARTARTVRVTFRSEPQSSLDDALLGELERLLDWIEDDQPCDALVFEIGLAPSGDPIAPVPPPPSLATVDRARRWEKLMIRLDRSEERRV